MTIKMDRSPVEILQELLGDNDVLEFRGVRLEAKEDPIILEFDQSALAGGAIGGITPALVAQAITQTVQRMMTRAPVIAEQTMADLSLAPKR